MSKATAATVSKKKLKEKLTDDILDLSLSSLDTVPVKEIAELTKVRKLNLSFNLLVSLPDDFIKLQNVRELDLSNNKLKSLPKNFGSLINLKSLDLLKNELVTLPASFCELKSLQWLDLKDNPLTEPLKKAAGDCFNEVQCRKCAANVIIFMKQVAADEERLRQLELKKKKEEQTKREAEEKEKAEQLRQQKKLEREQRRIVNEQKKQQIFESDEHVKGKETNGSASNGLHRNDEKLKKSSRGAARRLVSAVSFVVLLAVLAAMVFLVFSSYCEGGSQEFRRSLRNKQWLQTVLEAVDGRVCPSVVRNRPFIRELIKPFELF